VHSLNNTTGEDDCERLIGKDVERVAAYFRILSEKELRRITKKSVEIVGVQVYTRARCFPNTNQECYLLIRRAQLIGTEIFQRL
jgi:hypothetical protein